MTTARWHNAGLTMAILTGAAIAEAIPDVAALRIAVFRDFPYLYDGDLAYERAYLATLSESPRAITVIARHGARIVGASTGVPLIEAGAEWAAPFRAAGLPVENRFYCAESVLLTPWRGLGIGHAFFDARESHARGLGMTEACFCSVIRPENHPARPAGYRSNHVFWKKRGYAPLSGIIARFPWCDIGEATETEKQLQFWGRRL